MIFPVSGSIPGLKNRAALLSGAILQAFSDVCQRLHSLVEVCGSPGLTGDKVICACAVIFLALQTQLLSGIGQCEKLGSVSGHFSYHHSFPSLEADWSISFFCLFHMGTNGSFPSVPAALKGFLVSPEYIMQCCRASPFFLSTPCLYHVL